MKDICLLGATGSIGTSTIDILLERKDKFNLTAVSCNTRIDNLRVILNKFPSIKFVSVGVKDINSLQKEYPNVSFYNSEDSLTKIIELSKPYMVINALVGFVGLLPTLYTISNDIHLALANKESLVVGGELIIDLLKKHKGKLYPIDSEHVALAKLLKNKNNDDVKELVLTASGGSFRNLSREELNNVTVKDALNHPSWKMGDKITIDSATLINKAFEIIEAYYLFGFEESKIKVLLHDESYIHSLILMNDNSFMADIGPRDMKISISYALEEGNYVSSSLLPKLNIEDVASFNFRKLNEDRYPGLNLGRRVLKELGTMGCVFNAANEAANLCFRNGELPFSKIEEVIIYQMDSHRIIDHPTIEDLIYVHNLVYNDTLKYIKEERKWDL